ncbi:MAG: hypothetical protein PWP54_1382 [Thermosipho sp. (in: thermotogales)]|nr:hypothetical protein [Thermosipho sp. (in: thermotogales)]
MEFLKKELEMYKHFIGNKKFNINSIKKVEGKSLEVGDIFVIYTEFFPIYGIVIEKNGTLNETLFLTTELFLASSKAIRIKINHLADEVAMTHIVFYIFDDFATSHCEVIGKYEDLDKIKKNFEVLDSERYTGPREEFFNLEIEKLTPFYDLFFKKINEKIDEIEKIDEDKKILKIKIPGNFKKSEKAEILAADTKGIRGENFVGLVKENSLFIYPKDELIGKNGFVMYKNEKIYEGVIPEVLVIENFAEFATKSFENDLKLEVI